MKRGVWTYFLLLIFEGALRKWLLPGLSTPLLVIRDPIALGVLFSAHQWGLWPTSNYVKLAVGIGCVGFATALTMGHGSLLVATYGARILLIHFPFAFVMGQILNREDLLKIGRTTLWLTLPMALLIGLQFYSPQWAWVNRGVGGDMEGAGFSGAMGYMRPSGTFSFTNGISCFFGLAAAYIAYFWMEPKKVSPMLLLASASALLLSIPLSISRSLLFQVLIVAAFAFTVIIRSPKHLKQMVGGAFGVGVALALLMATPVFQHASDVLIARLATASRVEGGLEGTLVERFLGGMVGAITNADGQDLFGQGIGLGTNVGAVYTTGEATFLVAEVEWGRAIGELGPILGLAIVFVRIAMAFDFLGKGYRMLGKGDSLPWLLLGFGFLQVLQAGWAQPTALGFYTMSVGLVIASLRGTPVTGVRHIPVIQSDSLGTVDCATTR